MFCDEVLETIEAIAAGELTPTGAWPAHLASCANCAAALAARAIERLLQRRAGPGAAAAVHVTRTLARIRRARWRSDQMLDVGLQRRRSRWSWAPLSAAVAGYRTQRPDRGRRRRGRAVRQAAMALLRRIAPAVPLYAAATVLLVAALGIWWWAERDSTVSSGSANGE